MTSTFSLRGVNIDIGIRRFGTLEDAIAFGREWGFEFVVDDSSGWRAMWSTFGGLCIR